MFKTRFGMLDFAGNYRNSSKFKSSEGLSRCRKQKEQELHILSGSCEIYGYIRQKHKISDDESLMNFFLEVLQRREELEEQEKTCDGNILPTCYIQHIWTDGFVPRVVESSLGVARW